jgi:hypothetical protein
MSLTVSHKNIMNVGELEFANYKIKIFSKISKKIIQLQKWESFDIF